MGVLDGKVVLVTGAGGGIGRSHALAAAAAGARVVVNDLGGARDGTGRGEAMADRVVAEIGAAGGQAVANYDSVTDYEGCERMVSAALGSWSRLDAVVNNAGILRDRTFAKLSPEEWDLVVAVHLTGARNVTRAALDALKASGGAIVNTTSVSGLLGNFGQSNYAAAKAGVYGFTRVLALELRKYGVTANCVAPVAKTRMTEDIEMVDDEWGPEHISPLVVYLASDLANGVTGRVFGVQGQRIHVYEMHVNAGVEKPGDELWTAEEIAEKLDEIMAFPVGAPDEPGSDEDEVGQVFSHLPSGFVPGAVPGWRAVFHWVVAGGTDQTVAVEEDRCVVTPGRVGSPTCTVKIPKQVLIDLFRGQEDPAKVFMTGKASADNMGDLMKLGMAFDFAKVAAALQPTPRPVADNLEDPAPAGERLWPIGKRYDGGFWQVERDEFVAYAQATDDATPAYSGGDPVAPPMYHVRPFIRLMLKLARDPELDLDVLRLVHGEHTVRFHKLLRHGDVLQLRGSLDDVAVKGSGTVTRFGLYGFVDGELALSGSTSYFIRAKRTGEVAKKPPRPPPEPQPDPEFCFEQKVSEDQALRYASASGDDNPIHVDEATARAAGLPRTILHGLCTMALAQRDLIQHLAGGDPGRLKALSVRFAKPVFPGDTLQLKVWKDREGEYRFITENQSGQAVIVNGRAELAAG